MHFVYILKSDVDPKQIYTGITYDPNKRLRDHNAGKCKHTKKYKPWELIFYSGFQDENKAIKFEKYLKTSSGIAFRNKRLI